MNNRNARTKRDHAERMDRVLEYIQGHLDESLSLDELAGVACFSPYYFHRLFSGMVGESVRSYIRRLRLERAAGSLKHGDMSVTDIAFDAGFEAHEAFTRAFNSMFGVSPQRFRKECKVDFGRKQIEYWKEIAMEVKIIELEKMDVAYVRHIGPYKDCKPAWDALCGWAGPK